MKKPKNKELIKDDELTRIEAMEDGERTVKDWTFRPITALTISWLQRNGITEGDRDMVYRACAFAFIHSAPLADVRAVVNHKDDFTEAVDDWIAENITHHNEVVPIAEAMNKAFERYSKSTTFNAGGSGSGSGN